MPPSMKNTGRDGQDDPINVAKIIGASDLQGGFENDMANSLRSVLLPPAMLR